MGELVVLFAIKYGLAAHTCVTFFIIIVECRQYITNWQYSSNFEWTNVYIHHEVIVVLMFIH